MIRFLLGRLWQSAILLLLVSLIGFMVLHLAPGGPMSRFALTPGMTKETLDRIAEEMGLNRPLIVQYFDWLWSLIQGDWGQSFRDKRDVLAVIGSHLYATLLLMGGSTVISMLLGGWIGVRSAMRQGGSFDYAMTIFCFVALSIPTFWFGLVAIFIFSLWLGWLPAGNMITVGDGSLGDILIHLILPTIVLALVNVAIWARYMRAATLEVLGQDFIRTAKAKGLSPRRIMNKHILGNALVPMITLTGMQLPTLLGGALVTETVFTWPGMGRLFLDSLGYNDYPVVMGLLMFSAILVVVCNLLADVIVALVDPRIRLE
ncbi:ABC transporter permease [Xinfangfangia sp. CPCC 101601]|uniref:ABC transporter permease n=1 Tax=Pseudogemmobacter lacusdianii TaxID=3069608 RepID=A0ABU0W279_9RHOB|nr:ABC transporter permease [Xinfangfangia sp. CPCC 101601]MDQ2068127.1 ABC transporter permease [Xinfangfangia sp. CPCC 101601]